MKNKKIIIGFILLLLVILLGLLIFNYTSISQEEKEKIAIDKYNFEQLGKVREVLNGLDKTSYVFWGLDEFNREFNQDIVPIKNCYYISSSNGKEPYIFGFKLESDKYIKKYGTKYYAYPEYDLPIIPVCLGMGKLEGNDCGGDRKRDFFIKTISSPCE